MNKAFAAHLIDSLRAELEKTRHTNPDIIAAQIGAIGFACNRCGKCCRGSCGDNRVLLNSEDLSALENQSLRRDFVVPMSVGSEEILPDLFDCEGNLHTFGWMLRRRDTEDCALLGDNNKCKIYGFRPALCSTYPFFLHGGKLEISECEGIGAHVDDETAQALACAVIRRKTVELQDTIRMYENYCESGLSLEVRKTSFPEGVSIVVHDTDGVSYFSYD
jgi:hypothetical protein